MDGRKARLLIGVSALVMIPCTLIMVLSFWWIFLLWVATCVLVYSIDQLDLVATNERGKGLIDGNGEPFEFKLKWPRIDTENYDDMCAPFIATLVFGFVGLLCIGAGYAGDNIPQAGLVFALLLSVFLLAVVIFVLANNDVWVWLASKRKKVGDSLDAEQVPEEEEHDEHRCPACKYQLAKEEHETTIKAFDELRIEPELNALLIKLGIKAVPEDYEALAKMLGPHVKLAAKEAIKARKVRVCEARVQASRFLSEIMGTEVET